MLYAAKSHIGLIRRMNQDRFSVLANLSNQNFFVIADGMGGPPAGEVASQLAVDEVVRSISHTTSHTTTNVSDSVRLEEAIRTANEKIHEESLTHLEYEGMGTTIVCALVMSHQITLAHVGDCRGYIYQNGELMQITNDHSLVAELVRRGELTAEEAAVHPRRNIVTRCLDGTTQGVPDVDEIAWSRGDVLLLCSDGLSNLVQVEELVATLREVSQSDAQQAVDDAADRLIRLALERGGYDNITLIIALHDEGGDQG